MHLRVPNTSSLENLSQVSMMSSNERLYEKVEQLRNMTNFIGNTMDLAV